jgi:hypothetical protein
MRSVLIVLIGVALVGGRIAQVSAQSDGSALDGAWSIQQITNAKPVDNTMKKPVGLIVFSGKHYSMVYADAARPDFGQGGVAAATADQLRAIWGPVTANSGTFTVTGNTVRLVRVAAKQPNGMSSGNFLEFTFTRNGDSLSLTQVGGNNGPAANPQTLRLSRAR